MHRQPANVSTNKEKSTVLPDYDSPKELKNLLGGLGFSMQKKFGQNFLISRQVRAALAGFLKPAQNGRLGTDAEKRQYAAADKSACTVWEIGAGLGAMTELLLADGVRLTAFEIDKGFAALLRGFFGANGNFKLVEGDVQKTWRKELGISGKPDMLFGNLPYNISLEFVSSVIESGFIFEKMLFTMQKEAAQRITAETGSKNYTALSVLCSRIYECTIVKTIPPAAFWPSPHVESVAILFTPKQKPAACKDPVLFTKLVKALFSSRRKTVKNNLNEWLKSRGAAACTEDILKRAQLDGTVRAEVMRLYDFLPLSDIVSDVLGNIRYEK